MYTYTNNLAFCQVQYTPNNEIHFGDCSFSLDRELILSAAIQTSLSYAATTPGISHAPVNLDASVSTVISCVSELLPPLPLEPPLNYNYTNQVHFCQKLYTPDNEIHFGDCDFYPPPRDLSLNAEVDSGGLISSITAFAHAPLVLSAFVGVQSLTSNIVVISHSPLTLAASIPNQTTSALLVIAHAPLYLAAQVHINLSGSGGVVYDSLVWRGVTTTTNAISSRPQTIANTHRQTTKNHTVTASHKLLSNLCVPTNHATEAIWSSPKRVQSTTNVNYAKFIGQPQAIFTSYYAANFRIHSIHALNFAGSEYVPCQKITTHSPAFTTPQISHQLFNYGFAVTSSHRALTQPVFKSHNTLRITYIHGIPPTAGVCGSLVVVTPNIARDNVICLSNLWPAPGINVATLRIYGAACYTTFEIPVRRSYIVRNNFYLLTFVSNNLLDAYAFTASLDADSWTWTWSATIPGQQFNLVSEIITDPPLELTASLNGTLIRLVAESISWDHTHGKAALKLSGRGRTAYLASPYAPTLTWSQPQYRTAQQLAAEALTLNGVSIGWTVNWGLEDWVVADNAWSHTGTYITALNRIAEAGGGYLQPHDTEKTIRFLPRYPKPPWHWDDLNPDFELPQSIIITEKVDWEQKPQYNAVWVAGSASGGRLDRIVRTGTAADLMAPTITDDLATSEVMTRQRGLRVLSESGGIKTMSLSLPILASTGIIRPGHIVSYQWQGDNYLGIVRGVSVSFSFPTASQTIQVEVR